MFLKVITFLIIVSCYTARLIIPHDDGYFTDLKKQKGDLPRNRFILKRSLTLARTKSFFTPNTSSIYTTQPTKKQEKRVTKMQYEIINLLWRKTKIFVDVESSTAKLDNVTMKMLDSIQEKDQNVFSYLPPISQAVTPSYIEFYYSDETDDSLGRLFLNRTRNLKSDSTTKSPLDYIHCSFSKSTNKPIQCPNKTIVETKSRLVSRVQRNNKEIITKTILSNCKTSNTDFTQNISDTTERTNQTESTTVYDKIKFFELYDKHTRVPFAKEATNFEFEYNESFDEEIEINNVSKILLKHVDQSSNEHSKTKHSNSKKHIVDTDKISSESSLNTTEENIQSKAFILNITTARQNNTTSYATNKSLVQLKPEEYQNVNSYLNESVLWSDFPYAAIYIYEASKVHCDAASISAHWLIASGSCLSRLSLNPVLGKGRSAFVAYCGDRWWKPERISYVKYSVVHPWYHPRDWRRRQLYNIGVIQVVTSMMSACSEWAPVPLMSHQFAASPEGSEALALGWGLDRYGTRYAARDLPKASLKVYKGLVFSDSCPGNTEYGKVKRFVEGGGGVKNVYCLSLPPYLGEERDPIHGSLLFVGGKLTAFYLQEERRRSGKQSAQYTGIWRLISWVVNVAKEPETESLTDEI